MFIRFLHRPALAVVISLLIRFMDAHLITTLPISQFSSAARPTVRTSALYAGARAKILIDAATVTLEQAVNDVPSTRYMKCKRWPLDAAGRVREGGGLSS